mmetsp:Transcript_12511/g.24380  ORF Transcript_12511/g.24380 Transcript_12511/m.24380 type:complete len:400 (+) Transcript_12511:63-1262(+)
MISPELMTKLERRRRLQPEVVYQSCRSASHGALGAQLSSSASTSASSTTQPLLARLDTIKEVVNKPRKAKEVARSIELGAEVARLRIDVEVLKRDLEVARLQAAKLRAGANLEQRHGGTTQHEAESDLHLATAMEHRDCCVSQIAEMRKGNKALEEEIAILEEEVARHVVGQVHLEKTLENSQEKEQELWRLIKEAEHRMRERTCERYALDDGSDSIGSAANVDVAAAADLERCFEDLGQHGDGAREEHGEEDRQSEHNEAGHSETIDDYEAPLQILEFALSRLRGSTANNGNCGDTVMLEAGSGGSNNMHSEELDSGVAAGTGEAADNMSAYDRHIDDLQMALRRLSTSGTVPDSSLASPPGDVQDPAPVRLLPMPVGLQLFNPYVSMGRRFRTRLLA